MKVIVIGGGVVGVTSAYYLNRAGHEVTLLERHPQVADETSFANGGQVSWSSATPWAEPGVPYKALYWLFKPHSPLVLRPRLDPALWRWLFQFLRNCMRAPYLRNKERQIRVARYSFAHLTELETRLNLRYDAVARGTLIVFRTKHALAGAQRDRPLWDRCELDVQQLDVDACIAREPALAAARDRLTGGLWFSGDSSGDCRAFTLALAAECRARGVEIHTGTGVTSLVGNAQRIERVETMRRDFTADAYILAAGCESPRLLQPLGMRLPVYPVKGYSLTVPVADARHAPLGTVTDEHHKVVITRLGDRIRAAGTAELAGYDLSLPPERLATINHVVRELFPGGGDFTRAEYWTGLRPMTPDNPPVLGPTPITNLFLNTGHGTFGWTMACGSAAVLADVVSGKKPEIDLEGLTLERFAR